MCEAGSSFISETTADAPEQVTRCDSRGQLGGISFLDKEGPWGRRGVLFLVPCSSPFCLPTPGLPPNCVTRCYEISFWLGLHRILTHLSYAAVEEAANDGPRLEDVRTSNSLGEKMKEVAERLCDVKAICLR